MRAPPWHLRVRACASGGGGGRNPRRHRCLQVLFKGFFPADVVGDIIEIGRRLSAAKGIAGHGGWLPWLEREFGWSDDTAINYMNVAALDTKSRTVRDLDLP